MEAAGVKLEFACREAALEKESEQLKEHLAIKHATMERKKSKVERECNLLEMERDLAVAIAESQVFVDAEGYTHCVSDCWKKNKVYFLSQLVHFLSQECSLFFKRGHKPGYFYLKRIKYRINDIYISGIPLEMYLYT